ncbi:helix-turn-helix domain-containing protein [Bacillus sp. AK031]
MLRFKNNITQRQIAEATGISVNSIVRYENNQRIPNKEVICKLAEFYKVDVGKILLDGKD